MLATELSEIEVRILGSLAEKEATTPDNYPLSLNGLTTACNQTTNRDPILTLTDDQVRWAVNNLRQHSLVRAIQPSDARVMKYQHLLREKLGLEPEELPVLAVLMLRGPQTVAELRTRTERYADLVGAFDADASLRALMTRGLAVVVPRQRGQKEERYAHLLAGAPPVSDDSAEPAQVAADQSSLTAELAALRQEIAELRRQFDEFRRQFG